MFGNYRIKLNDMIGQVMTSKRVHVTRGPFLLSFPSICMCVYVYKRIVTSGTVYLTVFKLGTTLGLKTSLTRLNFPFQNSSYKHFYSKYLKKTIYPVMVFGKSVKLHAMVFTVVKLY